MAAAARFVTIKCSNDELVNVDEAVAMEFPAVKKLTEAKGIEAVGIDAPFPLPNVPSTILAKVIEYCKYHLENRKTSNDKPATPEDEFKEFKAWDTDFMKVDSATCKNLIAAAKYLEIDNLQYLTCETLMAKYIKGKTFEEIKRIFDE